MCTQSDALLDGPDGSLHLTDACVWSDNVHVDGLHYILYASKLTVGVYVSDKESPIMVQLYNRIDLLVLDDCFVGAIGNWGNIAETDTERYGVQEVEALY